MSSRKRGQQAVGCVQDCNSRGGVLFFKFFKKRLQKHQHKNKRCFSHVKECIVYYHTYSKPTFASEAVEPIVSKQLYKVKSPDNETHNNNSLFTLKCVNSSWSTTALEKKKSCTTPAQSDKLPPVMSLSGPVALWIMWVAG